MAEQTFRSPGFFQQEIDQTQRQQSPVGVPAGVVGTSMKGPAFVPVTVGSMPDFESKFGTLDPKKFGPYAVNEFLKHRSAVTYMRVLGAGSNDTTDDIETTRVEGTVKNAGFVIDGSDSNDGLGRFKGVTQFIVAKHLVPVTEAMGYPAMLTDNDSFSLSTTNYVNLVRAMVLVPSGTRIMVLNGTGEAFSNTVDDVATLTNDEFKLVISSSAEAFATTDGLPSVRILTASLDPNSDNYVSKILNTDPERFIDYEHYLYADFAVEDELASVATTAAAVGVASGSDGSSEDSGDNTQRFRALYGRFDTRYTTPSSPSFISQPFGATEFDLFHFEALDDGAYANTKLKISIRDLRASTNPADEYGTFTVNIRAFDDEDTNPTVLESFPKVSLNPNAENYIAKSIGDKSVYFNFDATDDDERRLIVDGLYPNRSVYVRVVMNPAIARDQVPAKALPFGFRGVEALKTNDSLTDSETRALALGETGHLRLSMVHAGNSDLTGSIVPPIPMRFKVTKGQLSPVGTFSGDPGVSEIVDGRYHWGVKFERMPLTGTVTNAIYNTNASSAQNPLVSAYTKFLGIKKLDALVTGSGADAFLNNKFTLSNVAFSNGAITDLTGGIKEHVREMAFIRNATVNPVDYTLSDGILANRITFATLVNQTSSIDFNRFASYAKFSTFLYGGFDGFNILDRDAARMNDRAASSDAAGGAAASFVSPGLLTNVAGEGKDNSTVFAYKAATKLMTDPFVSSINILAIPGIRDSFVTDYAAAQTRDYSLAIYLMDAPEYDEDGNRLFDDSTEQPDPERTAEEFDSRAVDNNYSAVYFPDVQIDDAVNTRRVTVPASVAGMAALAYNDKSSYPWFAPAGFNRGSLDFVQNVSVRLTANDRDVLYDARINPIATFPREGFVIFGQKTLQQAKSALDRVNVRRLLLEIKRLISDVARRFVFEQNNAQTRTNFVSQITPLLALVQLQSGIESFSITMDSSNNTQEDIEANRLNGQIAVVPTRTIEFVAIDFVITNSGVSFG